MEDKIIDWSIERDILKYENRFKQLAKTGEEFGELCSAMLKDDKVEVIDSLGDIYITLVILAAQMDLSLDNCIERAFNVIEHRKGKTIAGTFIKE